MPRPRQRALARLEGESAGLLKFAGEHADSFYSWQGFMEGACLSGIRAADEVLADIRSGAL
jgi:monoamine oxidase